MLFDLAFKEPFNEQNIFFSVFNPGIKVYLI